MTVRDVVAAHATCRMDERRLLMALGLEPTPGRRKVQVRVWVRPHDQHGRSRYVPGCERCRRENAAYIRQWRAHGTTRRYRRRPQQLALFDVTSLETMST